MLMKANDPWNSFLQPFRSGRGAWIVWITVLEIGKSLILGNFMKQEYKQPYFEGNVFFWQAATFDLEINLGQCLCHSLCLRSKMSWKLRDRYHFSFTKTCHFADGDHKGWLVHPDNLVTTYNKGKNRILWFWYVLPIGRGFGVNSPQTERNSYHSDTVVNSEPWGITIVTCCTLYLFYDLEICDLHAV